MKINSKLSILVTLTLCIFCSSGILAQDIVPFEIIDNGSVGLTVVPYSKFGMAVGDINKDGYPEILTLRWNGDGEYSRLYLNQEGTFLDISNQTPLPQIEGAGSVALSRTTYFVDFDNDGDQDISMSNPEAI